MSLMAAGRRMSAGYFEKLTRISDGAGGFMQGVEASIFRRGFMGYYTHRAGAEGAQAGGVSAQVEAYFLLSDDPDLSALDISWRLRIEGGRRWRIIAINPSNRHQNALWIGLKSFEGHAGSDGLAD